MSRYVISGYYGFGNGGDEAILAAIIGSLRENDSDAQITVLSARPDDTAVEHKVSAISRTAFSAILNALRDADLFISGGGGLLQDATSSRSLLYYLSLLFLAHSQGCKTMVYANSIGPISKPRNKKLTHYVLEKVDYITVRDELSLRLLQDLGVQTPPIRLTADPVLLLEAPPAAPKPRQLVFAVRPWPGNHDYAAEIAEAGRRLAAAGYRILFVPFHGQRDLEISRSLAAAVGPQADCLEKNLNFDELLAVLNEAEVVVAMRLHALIMGTLCRRPLVGISYDPKVDGFLAAVEQPVAGTTADLRQEDLYEAVLAASENREEIEASLSLRLEQLRRLAAENGGIARSLSWR